MTSQQEVRRGYTCPRWLYVPGFVVPANTTLEMLPSKFDNETPWRWRLVNLTFTNPINDANPKSGVYDHWGRRLLVEIGKTGCSDQNIVQGSLSCICANQYRLRQKAGGVCLGMDMRLPTPFRLPRDTGFEVRVSNFHTDYPIIQPPAIVFRGRTEDGNPVILAADGPRQGLPPQTSHLMRSADLFNKGRREILIDRIIMKDIDCYYHETDPEASYLTTKGSWIGWLINPTLGTQWMPNGQPIPVGNLAPMAWRLTPTPLTFTDLTPKSYHFPPLTYLYPRQRLGIRWTNQSDDNISVNVALMMEMEVE